MQFLKLSKVLTHWSVGLWGWLTSLVIFIILIKIRFFFQIASGNLIPNKCIKVELENEYSCRKPNQFQFLKEIKTELPDEFNNLIYENNVSHLNTFAYQ